MSEGREHHGYIPKTLDNPPRWGVWDMYQGIIFFLLFGLGVVMHQMLAGLIVGALAVTIYRKMSKGGARGILNHAIYWYTPFTGTGKKKTLPPSSTRHFLG